MLKNKGNKIEHCGTPVMILWCLLKLSLILVTFYRGHKLAVF